MTVLKVKALKSTLLGSRYRGTIEWDLEVKTHSDQNLGTKEGTPSTSVRGRDRPGTRLNFSPPQHTSDSVVPPQPHGRRGVRREGLGEEPLDWGLGGLQGQQECL